VNSNNRFQADPFIGPKSNFLVAVALHVIKEFHIDRPMFTSAISIENKRSDPDWFFFPYF
jgi:hypothetical protein